MNFSLIKLFKERTVNHISNFSDTARCLDILKLERYYMELFKEAPKRAGRGLLIPFQRMLLNVLKAILAILKYGRFPLA